jgi:branched-chain amino acid transport system ATP-binding protein
VTQSQEVDVVKPILQLEGVTMRFGGLVAVSSVSLTVERGEIFGLIGPNGAGKTTLLNVISGVYKPVAGVVRLNNEEVTGQSPEKTCRKGLARTFQISHPFPKMTVLENVMVGTIFGKEAPPNDPRGWAEEMLDFVEFPVQKDALAQTLNTAQLKRVDLARAMATRPELLLLDEPGAGLTPAELTDLMRIIRKTMQRGISIVVVEHLMKMIMAICDRLAVLDHGEKIAEGIPREITKQQRVVDAYLGIESAV